jgi:hypothetical protein
MWIRGDQGLVVLGLSAVGLGGSTCEPKLDGFGLLSGPRRTCGPRLDEVELDYSCRPGQGVPVEQGLMGRSLTVAVGRGRAYL